MRFYIYQIIVFGVFLKGLDSVVQTDQTVMAAVGEEAHFSCQLTETKDVLQVTWQKVLLDSDKNLATYNNIYGQRVNPKFKDKVEFKDIGLQNNSIVIRNVTDQDEGCYLCLFNCYPEGALKGRTCLHLYELHEPILQVRESNSPEESVVSCSVTARPAPTVTLTVTQQHLNFLYSNTSTVTNTNATVTVTKTTVLTGFHGNGEQVGCVGRVPSGPQKEVFMKITEDKRTPANDDITWIIVSCVLVLCVVVLCGVAAGVCVSFKLKNKIRDPEKNQTPNTPVIDHHATPLISGENNRVTQRSSAKRNLRSNTPSTKKCPRKLFD